MDTLANPAIAAQMRGQPPVLIVRDDWTHATAPGITTNCRSYYMPHGPGPAPIGPLRPRRLPAARRGRPSTERRAQVAAHDQAVIAYEVALDAHRIALVQHARSVEEYESLPTTPRGGRERPEPRLIFTHGRGSRLDNPTIVAFAEGFARYDCIMLFEGEEDMTARVCTFRALMQSFPSASAVGGRSMGARCSARAALYSQVKKLIFMTYPIVRGLEERFDELVALTADIDVLMIIGDEDALAPEQQLKALRSRMRARTWWLKINKGDHALWFGDAGQRYSILNICGQIAARWSMDEARDPTLTESFIGWNGTTNRCEWTPWTAPAPEPVRGNTRFNIDVSGSHMQSGGGNFTVSLPP